MADAERNILFRLQTKGGRAVESEFKRALFNPVDAAKAKQKELTAATKKQDAAWRSAKEAAGVFGGRVNALAESADKARNSMRAGAEAGSALTSSLIAGGAAAAASAVLFAGGAIAIWKVTTATVAAIREAEEWNDELEDLGISVDQNATASVERFNDSMDAAAATGKALLIPMLAGVADVLEPAVRAAVQANLAFNDLFGSESQSAIAKTLDLVLKLDPGFRFLANSVILLDAATSSYRDEADALIGSMKKQSIAVDINKRGMSSLLDVSSALDAAQRSAAISASDEADAQKAAAAAKRENERQTRENLRVAQEAEKERLRRFEMEQRFSDSVIAMAEAEAAAEIRAHEKGVEAARRAALEIASIRQKRFDDSLSVASMEFGAIESLARTAQANLEKRDDLNQQQKQKRASQAFALQQTAAVGQIAIDGARAVLSLVPFFSFLGPAAPAAAIGVVAPVAAAQTAVVMGQEPPSFPMGGMVRDRASADHVMVSAQPDEAIVTGRGVAAAGGPAGIDALNRGAPMMPSTIRLEVGADFVAEGILSAEGERAVLHVIRRNRRNLGL